MPTFYDRFVECAERWPQNVAVELQRPDRIESYSYAELRRMAEAIAAWVRGRGIEAGARIAILADNHPRWVAAYLGIIAAGGTTVPLDTAYHADQVSKLLRDSGASVLICDQKHLEVAREVVAGTDVAILQTEVDFENLFAQVDNQSSKDFRPIPRQPDDVASLLYTSGTTADPKGVMLTHANLLAEADAVFAWAHIGPNDAILGVLPLFHVLSQMANLLLPLVAGTRVVYLSTLNTTELLRALRERNVTAFAVVPQFFNLIHERIFKEVQQRGAFARLAFKWLTRLNVSCRKFGLNPGRVFFRRIHELFGRRMRYLVTGGSRFDPQIARDFYSLGIDILQAYGLTETCGGAFVNSPGENVIGSVGKPLKGVEGKIVDLQPADDGLPASGEILIRGPIVMKGYWNRRDATAEVLKDGWLHTGDLGYFDERGNLFITGRKKDVIILANGKNVYPEEIEAHYLQSPLIKEICVLGLGDGGSEKLYAVITPNFEVLRQRKIVNTREVIRFDVEGLSAKLPSTKRIAGYEIWQEDLPRTSTRKLKRFEIEKRVGAGKHDGGGAERTISKPLSEEEASWLEQPDIQRAIKVIREYSPNHPERISPADNLELDLGLDSMRRVELLVALEHELGGDVEEARLADIYTVRELVDAVRESVASGKSPAKQFAGWGDVLREDPTQPAVLRITKPRPFTDRLIFVLTRLFKMIWNIFSGIEIEGLDNLPREGSFLLCSNHQSFLDPLPLLSVLPWWSLKRTFAVGTSEIFGSGKMMWVAKFLRVVVVDPDAHLIPAMRAGAYGLRHGMSLIMYPEGERSIDGTPKTFKKGAAILSVHLQVPIVPMAIDGFYEAWPRGKPFQKFAPLKMKIGKPMLPPPESEGSEETYAKLTAELKTRVVGMWEDIRSHH
ncbi:MAG: AMP-dependent synthetase and ligase [Acidobacteriaceae bacterium]|nr:AMP-dependent synthetase and ligase [Acidobacteriaceae bacterium]